MTNMQRTATQPHERLLIARRRAHLEVQVVARELDVSRKTISSWESGRSEPTASQVRLLSQVLGVPAGWLLNGDENDTDSDVTETSGTGGSTRSTTSDYSAEPFAGWDWAMAA